MLNLTLNDILYVIIQSNLNTHAWIMSHGHGRRRHSPPAPASQPRPLKIFTERKNTPSKLCNMVHGFQDVDYGTTTPKNKSLNVGIHCRTLHSSPGPPSSHTSTASISPRSPCSHPSPSPLTSLRLLVPHPLLPSSLPSPLSPPSFYLPLGR